MTWHIRYEMGNADLSLTRRLHDSSLWHDSAFLGRKKSGGSRFPRYKHKRLTSLLDARGVSELDQQPGFAISVL